MSKTVQKLFHAFTTGSVIISNATFISWNIVFIIIDLIQPRFLLQYKVQEDKNVPVSSGKLRSPNMPHSMSKLKSYRPTSLNS